MTTSLRVQLVLFIALVCAAFAIPCATAAPGDLDTSFGSGGKVLTSISGSYDNGRSVAMQGDGKIVVAGNASTNDFALVRYNADGTLDSGFGNGGKVTTNLAIGDDYSSFWCDGTSVVVQSDGKIVMAGTVGYYYENDPARYSNFALVRYNPDGTLDSSFGIGGKVNTFIGTESGAQSMALQGDGKIVVTGSSYNGSNWDIALVRYNPNGTLDNSFGNGGKVADHPGSGNDSGYSVVLQSDGKILVAASYLIRYNADGARDTTFGSGGTAAGGGASITLQSDGKIVVGEYSYNGSNWDFALVRYNSNGTLDSGFGIGGKASSDLAGSVVLQGDGKIVVAGTSYNSDSTSPDFALVRYNADGTLDSGFGIGGRVKTDFGGELTGDYCRSVALQSDGKIVAVGDSEWLGFAVARYDNALAPPVQTLAVSNIGSTSATLNGTVNANFNAGGGISAVSFDYGTTAGYGTNVSGTPSTVTGSSVTPVSRTLTGLEPGTTYHFRVKVTSAISTTNGNDVTFTTVQLNDANLTDLTLSSGTLNPSFSSSTTSYTATVPYATTSIVITPTLADSDATMTVTVNGVAVASGSANGVINLNVGNNTITTTINCPRRNCHAELYRDDNARSAKPWRSRSEFRHRR